MPSRLITFVLVGILALFATAGGASAAVEGLVAQTLRLEAPPLDVAVSPDGQWLFVLAEKKLLVFTIQGTPLGEYPLEKPAQQIRAQGPNLVLLYGANSGEVDYLVIDARFDFDNTGAPARGAPDAPVTITLFDDFQCPYCAQLAPTIAQVLELYPEQVKLVFRNFPLNIHPFARPAALAALAAERQGKFWEFHDQLFANYNRLDEARIAEIAGGLQLDLARWEADRADPALVARLEADQREAERVGLRGTPAVFVNGRLLQDRSLESFRRLIELELRRR